VHVVQRGTPFAADDPGMLQQSAYYVSRAHDVLRMDLTELAPAGPYRLIVDDAMTQQIEYFGTRHEALARWAEYDSAMRPNAAVDSAPAPLVFH